MSVRRRSAPTYQERQRDIRNRDNNDQTSTTTPVVAEHLHTWDELTSSQNGRWLTVTYRCRFCPATDDRKRKFR